MERKTAKKVDTGESEECLLHVYWTCLRGRGSMRPDDDNSHLIQRGHVAANLGLDHVPNPPFTDIEMQHIMFAAKMQAIRCLRDRKKTTRR